MTTAAARLTCSRPSRSRRSPQPRPWIVEARHYVERRSATTSGACMASQPTAGSTWPVSACGRVATRGSTVAEGNPSPSRRRPLAARRRSPAGGDCASAPRAPSGTWSCTAMAGCSSLDGKMFLATSELHPWSSTAHFCPTGLPRRSRGPDGFACTRGGSRGRTGSDSLQRKPTPGHR